MVFPPPGWLTPPIAPELDGIDPLAVPQEDPLAAMQPVAPLPVEPAIDDPFLAAMEGLSQPQQPDPLAVPPEQEPVAPARDGGFEAAMVPPGPNLPAIPSPEPSQLPVTGHTPETQLREDVGKLVQAGPEELALQQLEAQREADAEEARRRAEISQRDIEQREANEEQYQIMSKRAQAAAADANKIADDLASGRASERWWADRSTGQKIAGYLSAAINGWLNPGGQNSTLDLMERAIDRDIDAQRAALGAKRGLYSDLRAQGMNDFQAAETMRLAAFKEAEQQLAEQMENFDPRGTSARRGAAEIMGMRARQAETIANIERESRKAQLEERKVKVDEFSALSQDESRRAQASLGRAQLRESRAAREEAAKQREATAQQEAERELTKEDRELGVGGLTDPKTGRPFHFRNAAIAAEIENHKTNVDQSYGLLERMIDLRKEKEWSSDLLKSPEWQELKGDFAQLLLNKKELDKLGVLAGPDMDLMGAAFGTDDPTEFRDPLVGLENAKENMVEKFNFKLKNNQYPGTYQPEVPLDVRTERAESRARQEDQVALDKYGMTIEQMEIEYAKDIAGRKERGEPAPSQEVWAAARAAEHEKLKKSIERQRLSPPAGQAARDELKEGFEGFGR